MQKGSWSYASDCSLLDQVIATWGARLNRSTKVTNKNKIRDCKDLFRFSHCLLWDEALWFCCAVLYINNVVLYVNNACHFPIHCTSHVRLSLFRTSDWLGPLVCACAVRSPHGDNPPQIGAVWRAHGRCSRSEGASTAGNRPAFTMMTAVLLMWTDKKIRGDSRKTNKIVVVWTVRFEAIIEFGRGCHH